MCTMCRLYASHNQWICGKAFGYIIHIYLDIHMYIIMYMHINVTTNRYALLSSDITIIGWRVMDFFLIHYLFVYYFVRIDQICLETLMKF